MTQWIKLKSGWLDLGRVAIVSETSTGGLALYTSIELSASPARFVSDDDADAVRSYLARQQVNAGAGQERREPDLG